MNISLSSTLIGFATLSIAIVILVIIVGWLSWRLHIFTRGKNGASLEKTIQDILESHGSLLSFRSDMEDYLKSVERRLRKSVQGVHTIRFNPFRGTGDGGRQSFSTALLNEDGNGVVITSISNRDRVNIFAKPITKHGSEYELSEEESECITHARKTISDSKTK